jgi:protein-tyrosine phosphatase
VKNLYQAAQKLYQLQEVQKEKVYVHCTTGVSRSVTLVIVYLSLYMKHEHWNNLQLLKEFIESEYNNRNEPNLIAAQRVIDENKQFQMK